MQRTCDVVVVGARVAGSIAAALLAEQGYEVVVVDRATFPSPILSTHFFRGAGCVRVLRDLGVLQDVLALGSPPLVREYLFDGDDTEPAIGPPQDPGDVGYALSVRRERLDALLVERARRAGAEVWESTSARSLLREESDAVNGVEVEGPDGPVRVTARVVVGADGPGSFVAKHADAATQEFAPAQRAMYYRYVSGFRNPDGAWDGPEFSLRGDELVYVFPSDGDVACVAISPNLEGFRRARDDRAGYFDERLAAHPGLASRYAAATPEGPLHACGPKEHRVRVPWGPGWALVGDASIQQDPWTGLGMDNAATHATFLAEALVERLSGRASDGEAMTRYHERRDEHALDGFRETVAGGRDLSAG